MRLQHWLIVAALIPSGVFGLIKAEGPAPKPRPNYATVIGAIDQATLAVITYPDGSKAFVADHQWMTEFKRLLASAEGKPDSYCFCLNYPQIELATEEAKIGDVEVAHANKLRFGGACGSGDFVVGEKVAKAVALLAMSQQSNAMARPKKAPKKPLPPPRREIQP